MKINPVILRANDIRGKYPEELTPEAAERIGRAFTLFLKKKLKTKAPILLIARDIRASSDLLRQHLVEGIIMAGADVLDMGITTTPHFYFAVHEKKTIDGGIMITASHNPPEHNGFKFSLRGFGKVGKDQGLREVFQMAKEKAVRGREVGAIRFSPNERERYIARLKKLVPEIGELRAIVDAGGGSVSFLLPSLLSQYPILYKPLYFSPDPLLRDHSPNPLHPDIDLMMQKELKGGKYQIGVTFDADGDRAAFFDERGVRIRQDVIFALLARESLAANPRSRFVYEVTRGRFLEPFLQTHGGSLEISPVGGVFVRQLMKETDALLGGELAGHFYHRELFGIDSALLTTLKLFKLVAASRRPLSELSKGITEARLKQISLPLEAKALSKIRMNFKNAITSRLDGLSVEFPHWWFNIRKSNTERLIRLTVEADSEREVERRIKEIQRLLS